MLNMVIRKRSHSIVTVVVVRLVADLDALDASLLSGLLKRLGKQLSLLVEVVAGTLLQWASISSPTHGQDILVDRRKQEEKTYHINKHIQRTLPPLQKFRGIMLLPLVQVLLTKVSAERLLSPGGISRVRDRCKG